MLALWSLDGAGCLCAAAYGLMLAGLAAAVIRRRRRARREVEELRQRIREAEASILADGKIEGPKGRYRPKLWAHKWVLYAYGLPTPRRGWSALPDLPSDDDQPKRSKRPARGAPRHSPEDGAAQPRSGQAT